jgi:branched-chain amino acid transport system permease protein
MGRYKQDLLIFGGGLIALLALGPFLGGYYLRIITEMAILALFAQSLNVILGFGGLISFGHAAFYGFGGYATAILLRDTSLGLIPILALATILTTVWGLVVGAVCLRAARLYFAILTLAISQVLFVIVFQWYSFTSGDNGIHGLKVSQWLSRPYNYYCFTLGVVAAALFVIRLILNSPFGYALRSVRDNPERVEFLGANVWTIRLAAFVIAAGFGGLAGGLYVGFDHMAFPMMVHWSKSAEPLLMIILGGVSSFWGAPVGAVLFVFMELILVKVTTQWLFILGLTIMVLVLFFPKGVWGFIEAKLDRRKVLAEP